MSKDVPTKAELMDALNQTRRERDQAQREGEALVRKYRDLCAKYDELTGAREVDRGEDRKLIRAHEAEIVKLKAAVEEMTSVAAFMSLKVQAPEQAARAFTILGIDP